jgi:hypothetical protein
MDVPELITDWDTFTAGVSKFFSQKGQSVNILGFAGLCFDYSTFPW